MGLSLFSFTGGTRVRGIGASLIGQSNPNWNYVKVCGGWPFLISLTIITLLRSALMVFGSNGGPMDKIISATDRRNHPQLSFSKLDTAFSERYSFLVSVISVNLVMELSIFAVGSFRSAKMFHSKSFKHMMHAPMKFFESQPIGRIVNRFSRDISIIDSALWLFFVTFVDSITT